MPRPFVHDCGHYCLRKNEEKCCRCIREELGHRMTKNMFCPICWGTMRKYVDGLYFQACPVCGKTVETTDKDGTPIVAPLGACSKECDQKRDKNIIKESEGQRNVKTRAQENDGTLS